MKYAINNSFFAKITVGALVFLFVVGTFAPIVPYVFASETLVAPNAVSDLPTEEVSQDSSNVDSQALTENNESVTATDAIKQESAELISNEATSDSASEIIVNAGDQGISANSSFDTKISVDIFANGKENQLDLGQGEAFTLDWISANAVTCELFSDSQTLGSVVRNGSAGPFDINHQDYPAPGTSKTFKIECVDLNNALASDSVTVTAPAGVPQLPDAPMLSATTSASCGGYIELSWNSVSSAQSYNVYRGGSIIASTSQLSFIDNVLPDNSFSYTVTALNSSGESLASNVATAKSSVACTPAGASVDIFANGSQGPLVVNGEEIQLDWISANVVTCNLFSDNEDLGSVPRNGSAAPIGVNHPLYPDVGSSKTYTIRCSDLQNKIIADSVVVSRPETPSCVLPVITSDLSIEGKVGVELNYTITASSTSEVTFSVSNLPNWLKFNSSTGTLTGTPQNSGVYLVEIYAQNLCGKTGEVLTITIDSNGGGGGNQITVSLSADPTTINQGQSSTLTWSSTNATECSAPWTSATSTSGTQVVTPNTTAEYAITCTRNNNSATASATVTVINIPVCTLPTIVSPLSVTGKVGVSFNYNFVATSTGTSTLVLSVATSSLPTGLSYATSTQTISGIPSQSGVFSVQLSAKNDCGEALNNLTITIDSNGGGGGNQITVSLSADPTTINQGQSSTLTWSSTNATECSAPWTSATSTSGTQVVTPNTTAEYAITCTNATVGASASTTITVNTPVSTSGGSSRSGGRGSSRSAIPQVLGATATCDYLEDYLRIDWANDPFEVIKLQVFLKELEGFKDLKITGVFDQATYNAVGIFQEKYEADILTPWGHDSATHFVYILTKKKVNEIVCNRAFPISSEQEKEITEFRAFLESLNSQGIQFDGSVNGVDFSKGQYKGQDVAKNDSILSENGMVFVGKGQISDAEATTSSTSTSIADKSIQNIAAAIVAGPQGLIDSLNALIIFLVFLLVVYLIAQAIVGRQNRNGELSYDAMRIRKMSFYSIGTFLSVVICLVAGIYEIVLPLVVFLIALCFWTLWLIFRKKEIRSVVPVDNK